MNNFKPYFVTDHALYAVYACGGPNDGEWLDEFDHYVDAVEFARNEQDHHPLGCFILDRDGNDVEWE